jgi:hypothetical protein
MADRAGRSASHALLYFRAVRQDGEVIRCLQTTCGVVGVGH